jgi:small subunit ribosomal protein S10
VDPIPVGTSGPGRRVSPSTRNASLMRSAVDRPGMPFVTTLEFASGDRRLLDDVVDDLKARAERKGAKLKGPHPRPPTDLTVPQSERLSADGGAFDSWGYTVYTRTVEIVGHDDFARDVAGDDYPDRIHVEAEIQQQRQLGQGN